jgi:hypothetical protein
MVTEQGIKLRTKLENAKTLKAITGESETVAAGEMVKVHDTIGIVVEDAEESSAFVLVYAAEKIIVPKLTGTGIAFAPGDSVYYKTADKKVTNASSGNTLCGKALETVGDTDTEVLIDLIPLV